MLEAFLLPGFGSFSLSGGLHGDKHMAAAGAEAFPINNHLITSIRLQIHAVWWVSSRYSVIIPQHHYAALVYL